MMDRMMKAEAVHGAQATGRVCVLLHAEEFNLGGFMERMPVYDQPAKG